MFASRRKSCVRGQGGRAAGCDLCRDWELFNTVIGPTDVIYPQRASAVAACRSSGVVGVAAQIPACPIRPTHQAKRSQLSAVFNGTKFGAAPRIDNHPVAPQHQIDDPPTITIRQTRAVRAAIRPARPISRFTMSCRTDTWKRSTSLPTGMAPVANGSNHRPGAVVEGERGPGTRPMSGTAMSSGGTAASAHVSLDRR